MTDGDDPIRLTDPRSKAPSELSELFRDATLELPSAERLEAVRARLPAAGDPKGTSLGGQSPALGKLVVGVVAVGIAGVIAVLVARRGTEGTPPFPSSIPSSSSAPVPSASPAVVPQVQPLEESVPSASPQTAVSASPPASPSAVTSKRTSEAALLERARRALGTDPELALALVRRHRTEFPNGSLRQEREVIGIEALRKLGRSEEAKRKASDFRHDFPDSAHGRAVEKGQPK